MVNRAIPKCRIQKNAIAIGVFDQTDASPDLASKLPLELFNVVLHANRLSNLGNFFFRNPNKTSFRPGATVSALRALEGKALGIPWKLGRGIFGLCHIVML